MKRRTVIKGAFLGASTCAAASIVPSALANSALANTAGTSPHKLNNTLHHLIYDARYQ